MDEATPTPEAKTIGPGRAMPHRRLFRNAVQCGRCKEIIESTNRNDFVTCSCGGLFVDGGLHYERRGGSENGFGNCIEMYVYYADDSD